MVFNFFSPSLRTFISEDGSLKIYNATKSDAGAYTCIAMNQFGVARGVGSLIVKGTLLSSFALYAWGRRTCIFDSPCWDVREYHSTVWGRLWTNSSYWHGGCWDAFGKPEGALPSCRWSLGFDFLDGDTCNKYKKPFPTPVSVFK